jgi:hypothetical protein
MAPKKYFSAKNQLASRLRARKYQLVRRFGLPDTALGGHLSQTYRRCGKPSCHCAFGLGHPRWALEYSFEGKKHVEILPKALALELAPLVEQGRAFREAVLEVLAINVQLFRLWRLEQRAKEAKTRSPKSKKAARRK